MGTMSKILVGTVVLVVVGIATFLVLWDIPAPIANVERVIPDDRFPK